MVFAFRIYNNTRLLFFLSLVSIQHPPKADQMWYFFSNIENIYKKPKMSYIHFTSSQWRFLMRKWFLAILICFLYYVASLHHQGFSVALLLQSWCHASSENWLLLSATIILSNQQTKYYIVCEHYTDIDFSLLSWNVSTIEFKIGICLTFFFFCSFFTLWSDSFISSPVSWKEK